jgi:hypothetical protein
MLRDCTGSCGKEKTPFQILIQGPHLTGGCRCDKRLDLNYFENNTEWIWNLPQLWCRAMIWGRQSTFL